VTGKVPEPSNGAPWKAIADIGNDREGESHVMQLELSPKSALYAAINGLERLYLKGLGASERVLECPAHAYLGLRIALSCAVAKQWPTAFVSETISPDQAALHLLSLLARTPLDAVASHQTKEADFTRLIEAAGRLASSPLFLLSDDASQFETTTKAILGLTRSAKLKAVINERSRIASSADWCGRQATLCGVRGVRIYVVAAAGANSECFGAG
jgi:replicative DNA helicase